MFLLKQRQQQFQPNIYLPPVISEQKEKEEAQLRKNTEQEEDDNDSSNEEKIYLEEKVHVHLEDKK